MEAGIGISEDRVKSIQALIKDVLPSAVVTSLDKLSSDEFATPTIKSKSSKLSINVLVSSVSITKRKRTIKTRILILLLQDEKALERLYEMAKAKGEDHNVGVKRLLFTAYAKNRDLEKMNQIKKVSD